MGGLGATRCCLWVQNCARGTVPTTVVACACACVGMLFVYDDLRGFPPHTLASGSVVAAQGTKTRHRIH